MSATPATMGLAYKTTHNEEDLQDCLTVLPFIFHKKKKKKKAESIFWKDLVKKVVNEQEMPKQL